MICTAYRADPEYDMGPATEVKYPVPPEFDDEQTLDEEEALEGSEDSHELSNLQKVYLRIT